jgi:hypothetical protein
MFPLETKSDCCILFDKKNYSLDKKITTTSCAAAVGKIWHIRVITHLIIFEFWLGRGAFLKKNHPNVMGKQECRVFSRS